MTNRGVSVLVLLLPFLEQENAFRVWEPTFSTAGASWWGSNLLPVLPGYGQAPPSGIPYANANPIKTFICPSSPIQYSSMNLTAYRFLGIQGKHYPSGGIWSLPPSIASPVLNNTTSILTTGSGFGITISQTAKTNYLPSIGYIQNDLFIGAFQYNSLQRGISLSNILDGTSNTIGFCETAGGLCFAGTANEGWNYFAYGHGYFASDSGICPNSTNTNCNNTSAGRGLSAGIPGSLHGNNRINCLFMDGSIRAINSNLTFSTYVYISGISDGISVNFD